MIRLYLDWNIYSRMKDGSLSELESILLANRHRFNIFYSTAHIGDIYKSYSDTGGITVQIKSDLQIIKRMTSDLCFVPGNKDIMIGERDPMELFESRIESESFVSNLFSSWKSGDKSDDISLASLSASMAQLQLSNFGTTEAE